MSFTNLKISTRLIGSFCALLLLMGIIGCCGSWGIGKMRWHLNDVAAFNAKVVENAQRALTDINALRRYESDVLLHIDDRADLDVYKRKWDQSLELLNARMNEMQELAESDKDKETVAAVQNDVSSYSAGFNNLFSRIRFGNIKSARAADKWMVQLREAASLADNRMAYFAEMMDNRLQGRIREANERSETLQSMLLALAVIGAGLSILLAAVLVGTIMRPINSLFTTLKDMAEGKEDAMSRDALDSQREAGARPAYSGGFDIRERLTEATLAATGGIEMSATAGESARKLTMAADHFHEINRLAAGGQSGVQMAVDRLTLLKREAEKSSKLIERLGKSSERFENVATSIRELADQVSSKVQSEKRTARMTRSQRKVLSLFPSGSVLQLPNRD